MCAASLRASALSDEALELICSLVYTRCGIPLGPSKKAMIVARLSKRVRSLRMSSIGEYCDFIVSPEGRREEMTHLVDVMTTNTTEFFRESRHFSFLAREGIDLVIPANCPSEDRPLRVWSAGCSTGEEPYTIAMVLSEYFQGCVDRFSILATDISTRVLETARRAVYSEEQVSGIPPDLLVKYLMRGKGSREGSWRIVPELRERVELQKLNLMDTHLAIDGPMDIIFCRNVVIYFDGPSKSRLISRFYDHLAPGGLLFIGHSETLSGINSQFVPVEPTIYRKLDSQ